MMLRTMTLFGVLLASTTTLAADKQFGTTGVITPSGSITLSRTESKPAQGDSSSTTMFGLAPGAMYFISDNLAVGGHLLVQHTSDDDDDSLTAYGIAPSVGYNLPLGESLSLFPSLSLSLLKGSMTMTVLDASIDASTTLVSLAIDAPVLYHMGNFFVGFGPSFSMDLVSKISADGNSDDGDKSTVVGLTSQIGGWF